MRWLSGLFKITPLDKPGDSAAAYMPLVMVSRGLAFVRTLLVVRVLGASGQYALGQYQPALEFVNLLVTLILFGAADVVERYVSRIEDELGPGAARYWVTRQSGRVLFTGLAAGAALIACGRWIAPVIWGRVSTPSLLLLCTLAATALALYQLLASTLRGMRAYRAAAGMEFLSATLLLALSTFAAFSRSAAWLMTAYATSVATVFLVYGVLLLRYAPAAGMVLAGIPAPVHGGPVVLSYATPRRTPNPTVFAAWALVRLLLVMLFSFLSIWGVRFLGDRWAPLDFTEEPGTFAAAAYSVPFRVAQLLGFLALTLWSSTYGLVARSWSQGRIRRARVQYFRVGRLGLATLTVVAVGLVVSRHLIGAALPAYATSIDQFLPSTAALFIWYAMAAFFSSYADLREQPERGAALWGAAVLVQGLAIYHAMPEYRVIWNCGGPVNYMLTASAAGLCAGLLVIGPALLWRPFRLSGVGLPLMAMGLASASLFIWPEIVGNVAPAVMLGSLLLLAVTGQLIRPVDRRFIRNWWRHRWS